MGSTVPTLNIALYSVPIRTVLECDVRFDIGKSRSGKGKSPSPQFSGNFGPNMAPSVCQLPHISANHEMHIVDDRSSLRLAVTLGIESVRE